MSDEKQTPPPLAEQPIQHQSAQQPADTWQTVIPTKNGPALTAYYLGVFSLIPCLALILAPIALGFGIKGLKLIKENPETPGKAHALVGVILGGLCLLANLSWVILVIVAALTQRTQ